MIVDSPPRSVNQAAPPPTATARSPLSDRSGVAELADEARSQRGRRWFWWLGAICAVALGAAVVWRVQSSRPAPTQYVSKAVTRGDLQATVVATGTLEAQSQVEVGAEVSGRVVLVTADYNDRVDAGQILCQLDPQQWHAAVKQASAELAADRATLDSARAAQEEAELNLERTESLVVEAVASMQAYEAARSTAQRARANVALAISRIAVASAALESARTSLEKTIIRAPMAGVVLVRAVEPGQTVAANFSAPVLFVLARDLTRMELHVHIDEADIGQVAPGQAASFSVDTYATRRFPAKLTTIYNIATTQNNVVTYEARLQVDNSELLLRPGMTATVNIITAERQRALLVPNAALRFTPPSASVGQDRGPPMPIFGRRPEPAQPAESLESRPNLWVLGARGPEPRRVQVGLSDGESSEILAGQLDVGELVLTDLIVRGG